MSPARAEPTRRDSVSTEDWTTRAAPSGAPVLVRLMLSPGQARQAHLTSPLLGTVSQLIGADGTGGVVSGDGHHERGTFTFRLR